MVPYETREYQQRIIAKTANEYRKGFKSVLLTSPCGSGKTYMGLLILKHLLEIADFSIGWVAMRRKLLIQAQEENERVGVRNIEFISMFDKHPPKKDFLVIDEGHHAAAATCADLYREMEIKRSLALTGTPFRTDRIKLSFEKIIDDCGVRFLIEQGYLSPFRQYVIPKWTPETITELFLSDPKQWGPSVIYMNSLTLCDHVAAILTEAGINARVVHGGQSHEEHDLIYNAFEDGKIQVLVNVYLLCEGFNAPALQTVWVRDSGKLCTIQMCGRVLRKDPQNPAKIANIVQSEETWYPYTKVTKAAEQFIWQDGQWLALQASKLIDQVSNLVQTEIATLPVDLPNYLSLENGGTICVSSKGKVTFNKPIHKEPVINEIFSLEQALRLDNIDPSAVV